MSTMKPNFLRRVSNVLNVVAPLATAFANFADAFTRLAQTAKTITNGLAPSERALLRMHPAIVPDAQRAAYEMVSAVVFDELEPHLRAYIEALNALGHAVGDALALKDAQFGDAFTMGIDAGCDALGAFVFDNEFRTALYNGDNAAQQAIVQRKIEEIQALFEARKAMQEALRAAH